MSRRRPLRESRDEVDDQGEQESKQQEELEESKASPACDSALPSPPHNPLQWLVVPWHLSMVVFYSLLLYHGLNLVNDNLHILDPKGKIPVLGGRFKFLTHINQWVQLAFFSLQLVTDIIPACYRKHFQKVSDVFFTCIAFPLAAMVVIPFWSIYAMDRELIYPEVFDKFIPAYINHFWHTTVLLWVLFEMYLFHHHFPSVATAAACVFAYGSGYTSWVVYIYVQTNWWCYGFMNHLPPAIMAVFFASCLFFSLGMHLVGKRIAHARWGVTTHIKGL